MSFKDHWKYFEYICTKNKFKVTNKGFFKKSKSGYALYPVTIDWLEFLEMFEIDSSQWSEDLSESEILDLVKSSPYYSPIYHSKRESPYLELRGEDLPKKKAKKSLFTVKEYVSVSAPARKNKSAMLKGEYYVTKSSYSLDSVKKGLVKLKCLSKRSSTFLLKDPKCQCCGVEVKTLKVQKHKGVEADKWHVNAYGSNGILMTVDHIFPKSKGGKDNLNNYQVMCMPCNIRKGDKVR